MKSRKPRKELRKRGKTRVLSVLSLNQSLTPLEAKMAPIDSPKREKSQRARRRVKRRLLGSKQNPVVGPIFQSTSPRALALMP